MPRMWVAHTAPASVATDRKTHSASEIFAATTHRVVQVPSSMSREEYYLEYHARRSDTCVFIRRPHARKTPTPKYQTRVRRSASTTCTVSSSKLCTAHVTPPRIGNAHAPRGYRS